jgi:ArsR family transcriptional regulator
VFKALAHPVRLYIAEQVRTAPRSVGQLARLVHQDSSTVCRHLWLLKNAGLIRSQKRGTYVFYTAATATAHSMLECIRKAQSGRPSGR